MTHIEQKKIVRELAEYESRMSRDDQERFAMYRKRDKDDEDLDEMSKAKLKAMHAKYVVRKQAVGNPLDALFKKSD